MSRIYDSKFVEKTTAAGLSQEDLVQTLDQILKFLGKEIVKTRYVSHGDRPIDEITLSDIGQTKPGLFNFDGSKVS
jgi:hypothetical protein